MAKKISKKGKRSAKPSAGHKITATEIEERVKQVSAWVAASEAMVHDMMVAWGLHLAEYAEAERKKQLIKDLVDGKELRTKTRKRKTL